MAFTSWLNGEAVSGQATLDWPSSVVCLDLFLRAGRFCQPHVPFIFYFPFSLFKVGISGRGTHSGDASNVSLVGPRAPTITLT